MSAGAPFVIDVDELVISMVSGDSSKWTLRWDVEGLRVVVSEIERVSSVSVTIIDGAGDVVVVLGVAF